MEILHKKQNHKLYSDGFYGNKLQVWNTLEELKKNPPRGNIIPRYNGLGGGTNWLKYGSPISPSQAKIIHDTWLANGAESKRIFFNEAAPDDRLTIQGEVMLSEEHLSLFWSSEQTQMRKALQNGKQDYGLRAQLLLRHHLNGNSYDDLQDLLDMFPNHVIEFSTYECCLGSGRGRNTIIWEVRKY